MLWLNVSLRWECEGRDCGKERGRGVLGLGLHRSTCHPFGGGGSARRTLGSGSRFAEYRVASVSTFRGWMGLRDLVGRGKRRNKYWRDVGQLM